MKTKKNIWLWASYDFANSIVSVVFFLYFSQWIVIERGVSDLAYNLTYTYATIALIFTVPITGFLLDTKFRRMGGLRTVTFASVLSYTLCAISGIAGNNFWSLLWFSVGMYFYLLTFTFYTPLISEVSHKGNVGKISGIGIAANYAGQFAGLLIALPFAKGVFSLFGASARLETLIPATITYFLLTLPMLIFFKEAPREFEKNAAVSGSHSNTNGNHTVAQNNHAVFRGMFTDGAKQHWHTMIRKSRELFGYKSVTLFFLAYFFFNDAVLTAANNFPIFIEQVWGVSDTIKSAVLAGIVITSAFGGFIGGKIADKVGHKKTLLWILYGWVLILPSIAYAPNFALFIIGTTCMGIWFGASWTVSRSVMVYLTPSNMQNLTFGYFGLIERTSSLLGPIAWGLTLSGLASIGSDRYKIAVLVITVFVVFGIMSLKPVRSDRE